jgi:hypothetical protein
MRELCLRSWSAYDVIKCEAGFDAELSCGSIRAGKLVSCM